MQPSMQPPIPRPSMSLPKTYRDTYPGNYGGLGRENIRRLNNSSTYPLCGRYRLL